MAFFFTMKLASVTLLKSVHAALLSHRAPATEQGHPYRARQQ